MDIDRQLVLFRAALDAQIAGYDDRAQANIDRMSWWFRYLLVLPVMWSIWMVLRAWVFTRRPR